LFVAEQKQQVRDISRRGNKRSMTWVRNPNDSSTQANKKQSVMQAAAAFLAEAAKDLVPISGTSSDGSVSPYSSITIFHLEMFLQCESIESSTSLSCFLDPKHIL